MTKHLKLTREELYLLRCIMQEVVFQGGMQERKKIVIPINDLEMYEDYWKMSVGVRNKVEKKLFNK